jgi:hypothetical protein
MIKMPNTSKLLHTSCDNTSNKVCVIIGVHFRVHHSHSVSGLHAEIKNAGGTFLKWLGRNCFIAIE